jgi:hypothetical protein
MRRTPRSRKAERVCEVGTAWSVCCEEEEKEEEAADEEEEE